jgi:signal transduction histidine kinase
VGSSSVVVASSGVALAGRPAGSIAVAVPATDDPSSRNASAARLIAVVLLAMVAAVGVGVLVSRTILTQLGPLVRTARDLGGGDLTARAPILADDEHGELAVAFNRMADQLEAEHATLEAKVSERTDEIRRLLHDRTEFFAGLSHELRTPLAVITTQSAMLGTYGPADPTVAEVTATIEAAARQLMKMVDAILDLARAEAGGLETTLRRLRLRSVLDELKPMLVRLGDASGVTVEITGRAPTVLADRARLRDVLLNLVGNAIKYTPGGGRVEVRTQVVGEEVRVSVRDTGPGIPPEIGDRVFEPFFRVPGVEPAAGQPATGLGLALARRAVEAQDGAIGWMPNEGGGTVFWFTLRRPT